MGSKLFTSGCLQTLEEACLTGLTHIQTDRLAPVFVVVPGNLLALHLRRSLARANGSGHANIRFVTLVDFADQLAGKEFIRTGKRAVTPLAEEIILRKAISEAVPSGGYFAEIKDHVTFCQSVAATLTDIREALIGPEELESWAARFPEPKTGRHKLKELAGIYSRHREYLKRTGLFDRNDLLSQCVTLLQEDSIADFDLVFYGFYDFNPLQRSLVETLLKKKAALFFFPWIDGPAFDYALPTLTWLKNLGCEHLPLADKASAAEERPLEKISEFLFSPFHRAPQPRNAGDCIEILSAPGEAREATEIARKCLEWVRERGFNFSDIGILLRSQEPYAPLLAETFSHAGIPFYLQGGTPLWNSREGQCLRLIFKILKEDWSRASVMEFITFAPLAFDDIHRKKAAYADPALWELLSLQAGIAGGRAEWQERLGRLLGSKEEERAAVTAFSRFMDRLMGLLGNMPQRGPWSEMSRNLIVIVQELFLPSDRMQRIIDEVAKLAGGDFLGEEAGLGRFAQAVQSTLTLAREEASGFGKDAIFIGDLMSARGIPFRGVIVPGMVERLFPLKHRQDPVLLDRERQYLSETLKKELAQKERGFDEERLLFTLAVIGARERLLLTFPRLEPLTGREKIPSFFLLRLMEAVVGRTVDFGDFQDWPSLERIPLSRLFPRRAAESLTAAEYDLNQAEAALRERNMASLDYLHRLSPFFTGSLRAEAKRWGKKQFTEFDGVLSSRQSRTLLERRLAQNAFSFSPTRLETYARCPYRYFLEVLLDLGPWEETDKLEALSPPDRGTLVHRILFLFFSRLKKERRLPLAAQDRAYLNSLLMELAERVLQDFAAERATGYPLLWSLEKSRIRMSLEGFLKTELKDQEGFAPAYLEQSFHCPFPLDDKEGIILRGRIDRIDLSPDGKRARIIDYKTGKPQPIKDGEFKGGEALQLPLYLYAAGRQLQGVEVTGAAYTYVSEQAAYRRYLFTTEGWAGKLKTLRFLVGAAVAGIRKGIYPPRPASCSPCRFPLVCGHAARVLYERKCQDPRIAFLERIKEID